MLLFKKVIDLNLQGKVIFKSKIDQYTHNNKWLYFKND
ncbi:hypothetical protein Xenpb_01666 [Xenorhabdus sp. PB62.4]|nr:hypothetical protein [Xenorhabdus sp. PB62.4]